MPTDNIPQIAMEYLKEGNSKEDLIEWIWNLIPESERDKIVKEAQEQFTDPTMPMGPNGNRRID